MQSGTLLSNILFDLNSNSKLYVLTNNLINTNYTIIYLKFKQRRQNLLKYGSDVLERQRWEFVLLEEIVEVLLQHLKHEASVRAVLEALVSADEVELVRWLLRQAGEDWHLAGTFHSVKILWISDERSDMDVENVSSTLIFA